MRADRTPNLRVQPGCVHVGIFFFDFVGVSSGSFVGARPNRRPCLLRSFLRASSRTSRESLTYFLTPTPRDTAAAVPTTAQPIGPVAAATMPAPNAAPLLRLTVSVATRPTATALPVPPTVHPKILSAAFVLNFSFSSILFARSSSCSSVRSCCWWSTTVVSPTTNVCAI